MPGALNDIRRIATVALAALFFASAVGLGCAVTPVSAMSMPMGSSAFTCGIGAGPGSEGLCVYGDTPDSALPSTSPPRPFEVISYAPTGLTGRRAIGSSIASTRLASTPSSAVNEAPLRI